MRTESQSATAATHDAATSGSMDALVLELKKRDATIAQLQDENARLWRSYDMLKHELALVKRRLFVATAERVDTTQLQLEFKELVQKLEKLSGQLEPKVATGADDAVAASEAKPNAGSDAQSGSAKPKRERPKPTGRRNLEDADLPEVRVEIPDPLFEQLVAQGKAKRIESDESSCKLAYERGGPRRVVMVRLKYQTLDAQGETAIETAPKPPELIPRCMASASTLAMIANTKYCDGLPLYRIEQMFERWGFPLDRGTMSRWIEQVGAIFGATIIEAAKKEAFLDAFCIMTDATGFAVQPGPSDDGKRRPCRKGHYFVQIVDRDYIFFEFTPKETSSAVRAMFKGFGGYLQADAKSVYDVLFRPPEPDLFDAQSPPPTEVACWAHARRKFWEAAFAKEPAAREALLRIHKIFELDASYRKDNPPAKIKALRQKHLAPLVHEFLEFAARSYEACKGQRGSLRSAFGYCVRQRVALARFLEDGRLRLDNNPSESALRKVVMVRDASLFAGSDDHAEAAGHIMSLIAMARLHQLEPEQYLRDIIRVLPFWPRERFLELAPKHWAATRARIDARQLATEVGVIDVPPPAASSAQQPPADMA
jgi:transposase